VSVQKHVEAIVAGAPGTFGIYARNLGTAEIVDVNANRVMNTESAAKVFVLLYYDGWSSRACATHTSGSS
jgi:hypothetical protein